LLDLFLRGVDFGSDGPHLRIDRTPHVSHGLSEALQRIADPLSKILHVLAGETGGFLGLLRFGPHRRLLRLHSGDGFFIHDG
jgi:hypothetical protein